MVDPPLLALCLSPPVTRSRFARLTLTDVLPRTLPVEKAIAERDKALKANKNGASDAGDALMSSAGNTGLAPGASAVKKSRKKKVVAPAGEEAAEGSAKDGPEGSAKEPEAMEVDA